MALDLPTALPFFEHIQCNRFRKKIIHASGKAPLPVFGHCVGGQGNDGKPSLVAGPQDLVASR